MRPTTRRWLSAAAAIVVLFLASTQLRSLNGQREAYHLTAAPLPKSAEPSMMLRPLLALGRAPLTDYLWLRATKLKDQGRFFDADQLSRLICELQPRFASVWAFQAWNMAYNISVTLNSPEERWRWVKNGIELLRDKGIPMNPHNTQLYRELAWIFFHKVGDFSDDMHFYYKLQLALQVEDILGEPPPDFERPGQSRGDYYREYDLRPLAAAPDTYDALLQKVPEVADFATTLRKYGFDVSQYNIYLGLLNSLQKGDVQVGTAETGLEANRLRDLRNIMADPATATARSALESYWRAARLRKELAIDPQRMLELEDGFGIRFDLRLADTQALYWANVGLEKGADRRIAVDIQQLNTNRIEFFCLQKMFFRGRMAMGKGARLGEPPLLSPDIRFGEILFNIYLHETGLDRPGAKLPKSNLDLFGGFVGFTRTLVLRYAERERRKEAQEKFDFLKKYFPDSMYDKGFDAFIEAQFKADRSDDSFAKVVNRLNALIDRGIIRYAYGEEEEATLFMNRAREVYDNYHKNLVSKRNSLQPFKEILEERVHVAGEHMYRGSYEAICRRLGITPKPAQSEASSRPAT